MRKKNVIGLIVKAIFAALLYSALAGCAINHENRDSLPQNGSLKSAMLSSVQSSALSFEESFPSDQKQHGTVIDSGDEPYETSGRPESTHMVVSDEARHYQDGYEADNKSTVQYEISSSVRQTDLLINLNENLHDDTIVNTGFNFSAIPVRDHVIHQIRESYVYIELDDNGYALGAALAAASYELNKGTLPQDATHNTLSYGWLLYFKNYLNSSHVFISPYWLVGYGKGNFRWSYDSPVDDINGYKIYSDSVPYTDMRLGIGGEFARSYGLGLSVSATALMRLYDSYTDEGFVNEMFSSHLSHILGLSIALRL